MPPLDVDWERVATKVLVILSKCGIYSLISRFPRAYKLVFRELPRNARFVGRVGFTLISTTLHGHRTRLPGSENSSMALAQVKLTGRMSLES